MKKTLLLCLIACSTSASAIVIRHDRDDARYRELGERYPAAVAILPDGSGVLIAPDWVLTAAHVARGLPRDEMRVEIGEKKLAVTRIVVHRDWQEMGPHDIALLQLSEAVEDVEPARPYDRNDEVGQVVTFVGRGDFGTGLTGPKTMDRVKRGATNTVDADDDDWIFFTFDQGEGGTELEGVSGPGDSGGPALIVRDGVLYTLGVSVFADGENGPGRYGVREGYTRVSTHRDWIESVIGGP